MQAGVTSGTLASAAVGVTNVLGTLIAGGIIEKAGRKQLLSNSFIGQVGHRFFLSRGYSSRSSDTILDFCAYPRLTISTTSCLGMTQAGLTWHERTILILLFTR